MPKHWKRPLTQMYKINYNYGTSLYSGCLDELDRRGNNRLSGAYDLPRTTSERSSVRSANELMDELKAEGDAFVADQKHTDDLIARSLFEVQQRRRNIMRAVEV